MKFGRVLRSKMIPEWSGFYLDYKVLKKLLTPYKLLNKHYLRSEIEKDQIIIVNFDETDLQMLAKFEKRFDSIINREFNKITAFYNSKLKDLIKKWRLIRINSILLRQSKQRGDYDKNKAILKSAYQLYYKELKLVNEYININLEAYRKIFKKHRKYTHHFDPFNDIKSRFDELVQSKHVYHHRECIQNLLSHIEQDYLDSFYNRGDRKEGQENLRKIFQGRLISTFESFFFGFFFGLIVAFVLLMWMITWSEDISVDNDEVTKKIFPLFRGIGLLILYLWLLAWNVYGWTEYNINYKLIFNFSYHYSSISEILIRASIFTAVLLVMFLWFIILRQDYGEIADIISFLPMKYTPLVVWLIFFGYIFFPLKMFNFPGRMYFFKLLKEVFTSLITPITFRIHWSVDQLASFVITYKDFEYLLCYYSSSNNRQVAECLNPNRATLAPIIVLSLFSLRILHAVKQLKSNTGQHIVHIHSIVKYLMGIIVVLLSKYCTGISFRTFFPLWLIMTVLTVVYCYYTDLKYDWGFLEDKSKHRFLRNQLSYSNLTFYYMAIGLNIILRFAWALSISPDIVEHIPSSEFATAIIGFLELFRRSIWNFIKIEREHIANCGNFKAVEEYDLPFDRIEFNLEEKNIFKHELTNLLDREQDDEDDKVNHPPVSHEDIMKRVKSVSQIPSVPSEVNTLEAPLLNKQHSKEEYLSELPKIHKVSSLLSFHYKEDLNKLKLDTRELEDILKEIQDFKDFVKAKAEGFSVVQIQERLLSHPKLNPTSSLSVDDPNKSKESMLGNVNSKKTHVQFLSRSKTEL